MAQVLKGAGLQVANLCGHFLRAFFATHVSKDGGPKTIKKNGCFLFGCCLVIKKNVPWLVFPVDLFPCLNQSWNWSKDVKKKTCGFHPHGEQ